MKKDRDLNCLIMMWLMMASIYIGTIGSLYIGFCLAFPDNTTTTTAYSNAVEGIGK